MSPPKKSMGNKSVFPYSIHANIISKNDYSTTCFKNKSLFPAKCKKSTKCLKASNQFEELNMNIFGEKSNQLNQSISRREVISKEKELNNAVKHRSSKRYSITEEELKSGDSLEYDSFSPIIFSKEKKNNNSHCVKLGKNSYALMDGLSHEQHNSSLKTNKNGLDKKAEEALQNCFYKNIAEAINEQFIMETSNFDCDLEMFSLLQNKLRNLSLNRQKEEYTQGNVAKQSRIFHHLSNSKSMLCSPQNLAHSHFPSISKQPCNKNVNSPILFGAYVNPKQGKIIKSDSSSTTKGNDEYCVREEDNRDNFKVCSKKSIQANLITTYDKEKVNTDLEKALESAPWRVSNKPLTETGLHNKIDASSPLIGCTDESYNQKSFRHIFSAFSPERSTPLIEKSFRFDSGVGKGNLDQEYNELLNPIEFLKKTTRNRRKEKKIKKKKIVGKQHKTYLTSNYNWSPCRKSAILLDS